MFIQGKEKRIKVVLTGPALFLEQIVSLAHLLLLLSEIIILTEVPNLAEFMYETLQLE